MPAPAAIETGVVEKEAVDPGVVGADGAASGVGLEGVAGMPLERLEHEMVSLAGHLAAGTCSFLLMVGEFDARQGWESWEAYSCAHWLNWRCGVGLVAAREQVRVARALRGLPAVTAAYRSSSSR